MLKSSLLIVIPVFLVCSCEQEGRLESTANCFALGFFKELVNNKNNIVTSPLSVDILFSLLLVGSGGQTYEELKKGLGYDNMSTVQMQDAFRDKLSLLIRPNSNTLSVANSVWIQQYHRINKKFAVLAREKFFTDVFLADFEKRPRYVTEQINSWVKAKTQGLISSLFREELDQSSLIILASAVFFKGQWAKRFNISETRKGIFHNHGSYIDTSEVQLMTQQSVFKYNFDITIKAEVLEMEYVGKDLSMFILLPDRNMKFEDFEQSLTCESLKRSLDLVYPTLVDVTIPIFEITSFIDVQNTMCNMGIQRVFDLSANLTGIFKNLHVSKAVQKATFTVTEEGSESAVATVLTTSRRTVAQQTELSYFRADRPFVFLLRHKPSNLILFVGRVKELSNHP